MTCCRSRNSTSGVWAPAVFVGVDVSGVTFCDSSGLSALVRSRARAAEMTGSLRLASPSPQIQRLLSVAGLTRMFER